MIRETVLAEVQADTSELRREADRAATSLGQLGKSAKDSADRASVSIGGIQGALVSMNSALGVAHAALGALSKAKEFGDFAANVRKLEGVVRKGFVKDIQGALDGTVSKFDILQTAAKSWGKVTEEQMLLVFKASKELANRGFGDTTDNAEKFFEALRKGETGELKNFGLGLQATGDAAAKTAELYEKLREVVEKPVNVDRAVSDWERFTAKLKDFTDAAKEALGSAAMWAVSDTEADKFMKSAGAGATRSMEYLNPGMKIKRKRTLVRSGGYGSSSDRQTESWLNTPAPFQMGELTPDEMKERELIAKEYAKRLERRRRGGGGYTQPYATLGPAPWADFEAEEFDDGPAFSPFGGGTGPSQSPALRAALSRDAHGGKSFFDNLRGGTPKEVSDAKDQNFKKMVSESELLAGTFDVGKESATAFFDAVVSGSGNAAKAAAAGAAQKLKALAIEWSVEALGAIGQGILTRDGSKFAAAAKLAAAAAAAGAGAAALGAMAGGSGGSGGGGGSYAGGAGAFTPGGFSRDESRGGGGINVYINGAIGPAEDVAIWVQKGLDKARRAGYVSDSGPTRWKS